ncbi:MAG: XrtA/PEP-CTERM system TPR-repeat protein PrsT [Desulfovibrionales bacterium]
MIRVVLFLLLSCSLAISSCSSKTKEELFTEGLQQAQQGNPKGAIVLFKNALEKDQNYYEARFQLAKVYLTTGKYDQAERELQKVVRQDPKNEEVQLQLARLYNFTGKPDLALHEMENYLQSHPGSAEAYEIIGESHLRNRQPDLAEEFFGKALKVAPARITPKLELARIALSQGELAKSRELVSEILSQYPENTKALYLLAGLDARQKEDDQLLPLYQKIAKLDPDDYGARYKTGFLLLSQGKIEPARVQAEELIQGFPTRSEGPRLLGIIEYHQNNFQEAQTLLNRSVTMQPSLEGYYFLGLSLYQLNQLETALNHFRTCLDASPSFHQARLMTAMILLQQKRTPEAIFEAEQVLEKDPDNALALNILGSAYVAHGRTEEGLEHLDRAVALEPELADAHMKRGIVRLSLDNQEQAEANLLTAIEIAPKALHSREILFFHYMRQKEYQKALSLMEAGLSGTKDDALIYNNMAAAAFALKQTEQGIAYLKKAKEADPSFIDASMNLATFFASNSQFDQALEEYEHILSQEPGNLRALLNSAVLFEMRGEETKTLDYLTRAKQTNQLPGYLALAWYYLKHHQPEQALSTADEAIQSFEDNLPAMELKGRILMQQKKYSDSIDVFDRIKAKDSLLGMTLRTTAFQTMGSMDKAKDETKKVMQRDPAYGALLLAGIQAGESDLDSAIATLHQGLEADPANANLRMQLARMHSSQGQLNKAMAQYEMILQSESGHAPALFGKGTVHEQQGNLPEAERYYQESIARDENFAPALNNLAYMWVHQGKEKEALELAIRAFKIEPNNPGILDTLGFIFALNGNYQQAVPILEKAAALMPDNATILYHLALAYKGHEMPVEALNALQKAMDIGEFPEEKEAREMMHNLSRMTTSTQ